VRAIPACAGTLAGNVAAGTALDCIRTANLSTYDLLLATDVALLEMSAGATFTPNFDPEAGDESVYPFPPSVAFEREVYAKIPFIAGTNLDEGNFFLDCQYRWDG
jgi:acetylcholinesterase